MRNAAVVAFVAFVQIGAVSIAAQEPGAGLTLNEKPFASLFAPQTKPRSPRFILEVPPAEPRQSARRGPRPAIVCGLTLVPADPNVDSAILHHVPTDGP